MTAEQLIVGLGSDHGDDRVAWKLIDDLSRRPDFPARLRAIRGPLEMLAELEGCRRLILIDACPPAGAPGRITRLEWPDHRIRPSRQTSSHALDVGAALELATVLRLLPPRVVLFGVEIKQCGTLCEMSPEVAAALTELRRQVWNELQGS